MIIILLIIITIIIALTHTQYVAHGVQYLVYTLTTLRWLTYSSVTACSTEETFLHDFQEILGAHASELLENFEELFPRFV